MLLIRDVLLFVGILIQFASGISLTEDKADLELWHILTAHSQRLGWPNLSRTRATAIRTQRDVAANSTIMDNIGAGVNLKTVLFEPFGYTESSFDTLSDLMSVGVQTFLLDVYYNEFSESWLLCPEDKLRSAMRNSSSNECLTSEFNINKFIEGTNSFIQVTDNNLNVNTMFLLFRLHSINVFSNNTDDRKYLQSNVTSLQTFAEIEQLTLPIILADSSLPTLNNLLVRYNMRVFMIILENNMSSDTIEKTKNLQDSFFVSSNIDINDDDNANFIEYYPLKIQMEPAPPSKKQTMEDMSERGAFSFTYDSPDQPYDIETYWYSIRNGFTPILNHTFANISSISTYLELSSWAFSPFQPTLTNTDELEIPELFYNLTDDETPLSAALNLTTSDLNVSEIINLNISFVYDSHDHDSTDFINRCVVITEIGWIATDCTRKLSYICSNPHDRTDFVYGDEPRNYMKAASYCKRYPGNYELVLPTNVYENRELLNLMLPDEHYMWINLNSLSTRNCWVVGLNKNCPYQNVVSRRIFAGLIAPSAAVAFLLFVLLISMQFQRLDVHRNRRHWKKVMNEASKTDFDGIPS